MFSLSDALPMQSYPSKVWFLCVAVQISVWHNIFVSNQSIFLYEIGGIYRVWQDVYFIIAFIYFSKVHFNSWMV